MFLDNTKTEDDDIQSKAENTESEARRSWELSCSRCGTHGSSNNCQTRPHHLFQERRSINSQLGTSTVSSTNQSSFPSRSILPPSLYPTIIDITTDNTEKKSPSAMFDREHHILQQHFSRENVDNSNLSKVESESSETSSSSPSNRDFNDSSTDSIDSTKCATFLPRMSSFYQEALHAAEAIEEGEDELLLERLNQYGHISPKSSSREVQNDVCFANTRDPARRGNSFDFTDIDDSVEAACNSISPFYREALEIAGFAEEEFHLMQQHREIPRGEELRAGKIDERSAIDRACNTTISTPSSFYRSALKEATMIQQEGVADEFKDDEEGPFIIPAINDSTSTIHQRSVANAVYKPDFRSGRTTDGAGTFERRTWDTGRENRCIPYSVSSLSTSSLAYSPSTIAVHPDISYPNRSHSNSSKSSSDVLPVGVASLSSNQCSSSFIDDSYESTVTRSMIMPHLKNSVSSESSAVNATKMTEKNLLNQLRGTHYSRNTSYDSQVDEEELRLANYLSKFNLSSNSSLQSKGAFSYALSTGGNRSVSEEKIEEEQYCDQVFQSCSTTENNNEFLISQIKAMEECHKNNSRNDQELVISHPSFSNRTIRGKCRFRFSRDTASSTPPSSRERIQSRGRSRLEIRGISETRKAISNGISHVVTCKGCQGRLQAPVSYS
eukprot:CAMPEP_0197192560 /NCGR_PEP_ID=MMETSP1423-20130617/25221_1 /TAXON_ID=476441 /ORGANISM="Pseudo-nitzschia heimii, Strain UNC1101" /LENGTH=667 /DNA_ID=CAMNT_0042645461 /DNA_START=199 /DNA_END=2198 /DNA_ORIENTATION=+